MSPTSPHPRVREAIEQLLSQVRLGRSLSDAMAHSAAAFPAHAIAAVRAGEVSGTLADALLRVADSMRRVAALRAQVRTALIYPACIAAAVAVALVVLIGVVVPTLESIFAEAAHRLPWQTRFLVGCGRFIREHAAALIVGVAASAAALVLALRHERFRVRAETLALALPIVGPLLAASETARVAAMLSMLAAAGLPLVNALALARDGGRMRLTHEGLDAAALKLREGAKLHAALSGVATLSSRVLGLVRIGEATGRLGVLLEEAARDAEQQVKTAVERLLALLTPAMTLAFGGIAGFVLYTVMTSILSVNNLALRP
jgi:general secretion pathway protein F